jgi:hypothetical protein
VLARLDAGQPVDTELSTLREQLETLPGGTADAHDMVRRESLLRLALADAEQAAARGDGPSASRLLANTETQFTALLRQRPTYWQLRELQARRALLALRLGGGTGLSQARCDALKSGLQPAVDAGQAGLVLQAWLALQHCTSPSGSETPSDAARRLSAEGYVPLRPVPVFPRRS